MITVVIHIQNADTILAEVEELPDPHSSYITCTNPRARDGKPLIYIEREATRVLIPWSRITFVETMPSEEDQVEIESFFRD